MAHVHNLFRFYLIIPILKFLSFEIIIITTEFQFMSILVGGEVNVAGDN